MQKKYLDLKNSIEYELLETAGTILREGGLVLFPTETVYGLGANGLNEKAVQKIYKAKGRNPDNPLILHISDYEMLKTIAQTPTKVEKQLMEAFWPGPFTLVLNRKPIVPNIVTGGLDTVGVRMPSGKIAHELIKYAKVPVAAPSANLSGRPSGTKLEDILSEFKEKVDYIIDGGLSEIGIESTVVRVIEEVPHILRPGKITPEQIKDIVGNVIIDKNILGEISNDEVVMSPGMKYKHYAPKTKCILVYSESDKTLINKITEISKEYKSSLILCSSENENSYGDNKVISYGSKQNLEEVSKNLFTTLRKVDEFDVDIVIIEGVKNEGLGLAIMSRLLKACDYNFIGV